MILDGVYEKTLYRNEKTGETLFTVIPSERSYEMTDYGNIVCKGIIPRYPQLIPLRLSVTKMADGHFGVWKCTPFSYNKEVTRNFLETDIFKGVGPKKAESLAEKYENIFDIDYNNDVSPIFDRINYINKFEELYQYISANNGTFHHAYRIFKKYGVKCMDILSENPYLLCDITSFKLIDRFALGHGFDKFCEKRLKAILVEACRRNESSGNTCISYDDFLKIVSRIDEEVMPCHILGILLSDKSFVLKEIDGTLYVFGNQLFKAQESISYNIVRHLEMLPYEQETDIDLISTIEQEDGTTYDIEQRKAFGLLTSSGIKVITGGPGTGKTTVINGMIKYISKKYPNSSIVLAAPTANAAKRMREKTGVNATTIHKLLRIQPFNNTNELDFKRIDDDFIIIDESSFIDTKLASIILQSIKKDACIIFVGDVDQLPSVGPGAFFRDLIDSDIIETVKLTKIFRQGEGSLIIDNSLKIKNGESELLVSDDYEIIKVQDNEELKEKTLYYMTQLYNRSDPYQTRLYSPVRKRTYNICTNEFNKSLQGVYSDKSKKFLYGYTRFYIGDPVIFSRNNYKSGYCNGDEGVVIDIIEENNLKSGLLVRLDNEIIEIKGDDLLDIDVAYSITTHKSQGSECENAIIVVPAEPKGMLERSMIYVATTRAKNKVIIITEGDSLNKAIKNNRKNMRITCLREMMISAMRTKNANK